MLSGPNPNRKPNSDVIRTYYNGLDLFRGHDPGWVVYFPPGMGCAEAALYEAPFEHVKTRVFPRYGTKRERWWLHERPRPEMAKMLSGLNRYLATVKHAKHRIFVWVPTELLVSNAIEFFPRDDCYFFGILHSRVHEVWALKQGTRLETRPRYTPTTCFETFPFPRPTDGQRTVIAEAAQELDRLRNNWLNPPEWTREEVLEFPGSVGGPWTRYVHAPDGRGVGTVHFPRLVPKDDACAENWPHGRLRTSTTNSRLG